MGRERKGREQKWSGVDVERHVERHVERNVVRNVGDRVEGA